MMSDTEPENEEKERERLRRHVRILTDLGRLAGESLKLEHFLDQAVMQVARAVEINKVKVLRFRRETADLLVVAGVGWKDGVVRSATLSADLRSPAGRTFQTAEPSVILDIAEARGFLLSSMLREHEIVSLANVPIMIDGASWGVLEVDSEVVRAFNEDTMQFMSAAAAIMGVVVRRLAVDPHETHRLAVAAAQAEQRSTLLQELQHRVKNNFQVILASIALQKRRFESDDVHKALDHVANRISAISIAHDQLAQCEDGQVVDLASYLRALCTSIEQQVDGIAVEVDADEIELAIDRAVPVGLVLNEAVTNSVKHAFGGAGGRIRVSLKSGIGYGEARLSIVDNGRGGKLERPGGSGMKLMHSLARQIGAVVEQISSEEGTTISMTFPIIR